MPESTKRIPFFDYPAVYERFASEFQAALADVGRRGAFIQQSEIDELEKMLAAYSGVADCVAVSNATVGLQLAMMAGGLRPGAEVIISSHTMVATASAIYYAGGKPVPVDIGADHLIDPAAVRAAVTSETQAICPTQLNGRTCDMDALTRVAEESGLDIYEDSAQGLGSKFKGRAAGSWGRGNCLSFYPAKILGTLGDGGAILVNEPELAEQLRLMRDHGRVDRGDTVLWGFNARMDNLAAAFLLIQLRHFDETVARRRAIASRYQERLADVPGLKLPEAPGANADHFDTFQNYELESDFRDALQAGLSERGIGTLQQWGGWPIHRFEKLGFNQRIENVDRLFARMLMIPMNMALTDEDVDYICEAIEQIAETQEQS
ncbi:MAG: DegT/DnrJ/EryC1/StrS family aminotransferase [Candidatus Nanopelagicales bacterium]